MTWYNQSSPELLYDTLKSPRLTPPVSRNKSYASVPTLGAAEMLPVMFAPVISTQTEVSRPVSKSFRKSIAPVQGPFGSETRGAWIETATANLAANSSSTTTIISSPGLEFRHWEKYFPEVESPGQTSTGRSVQNSVNSTSYGVACYGTTLAL